MSNDPVLVAEMVWWIKHAIEAVFTVVPLYVGWKLGGRLVNWMFGEE